MSATHQWPITGLALSAADGHLYAVNACGVLRSLPPPARDGVHSDAELGAFRVGAFCFRRDGAAPPGLPARVQACALALGHGVAYVGTQTGIVCVHDLGLPGLPCRHTLAVQASAVLALAYDARARTLYTSAEEGRTLCAWTRRGPSLEHARVAFDTVDVATAPQGPVRALALSADGERLYAGGGVEPPSFGLDALWVSDPYEEPAPAAEPSAAHALRCWDVRARALVFERPGHAGCVRALALVLKDAQLVSCADDCTLRQWDARSGACLAVLRVHARPCALVAVPSASCVHAGFADGSTRAIRLMPSMVSSVPSSELSSSAEPSSTVSSGLSSAASEAPSAPRTLDWDAMDAGAGAGVGGGAVGEVCALTLSRADGSAPGASALFAATRNGGLSRRALRLPAWSRLTHGEFPAEFRAAVYALLLAISREGCAPWQLRLGGGTVDGPVDLIIGALAESSQRGPAERRAF